MVTVPVLKNKAIGNSESYVKKALPKLSSGKKPVFDKRPLFVDELGGLQYWSLTEEGRKLAPPEFNPQSPGFKEGNDSFQLRERYATLMFCCGGNKQRTLLTKNELAEFLNYTLFKLPSPEYRSMYIDTSIQEISGQALLGCIMVAGASEKTDVICNNIQKKATKLYNTFSLEELADSRLLVLTYLCGSPQLAREIEKRVVEDPDIDLNGIWLNVCPIEGLQRIRQVKG